MTGYTKMVLMLPAQNINSTLTRIISTLCVQSGVSQRRVILTTCCAVRQRLLEDHMGAPPVMPFHAGLEPGPHLNNLCLGITMKLWVYVLMVHFLEWLCWVPLPSKTGGSIPWLCQKGGGNSHSKIQESWLLKFLASPLSRCLWFLEGNAWFCLQWGQLGKSWDK